MIVPEQIEVIVLISMYKADVISRKRLGELLNVPEYVLDNIDYDLEHGNFTDAVNECFNS